MPKIKKKKTLKELQEEALIPEEEQPYEIPGNWVWVRLDSISEKITDGAHKTPPYTTEGVPFISVKDIYNNKISFENTKFISSNTHKELIKRCKPEKGDILITKSGTIGRTAVVTTEREFSLFVSVAIIKLYSRYINSKFVELFLSHNIKLLASQKYIKGSSIKNLHLNELRKFDISIPPLNEQKRIADKVERLLQKVEQAKQLIEEAKETFEKRRAAILDKAFRGELTKKWREENPQVDSITERYKEIKRERLSLVKNKRELNELEKMYKEFDTNEYSNCNNNNWLYLKANMFCHNINCGSTPSNHIKENGKVPFLKVYNIVENKINFHYKPQYIPENINNERLEKSKLYPNDVIMNIVGPPLKKIAIIPDDFPEWNMNQALVRFRPVKHVLPKYVYYCLQYDKTLKNVINDTHGVVGQSNISITQSRNLVMPIPRLGEQQKIVETLDSLLKNGETTKNHLFNEDIYDRLKQSILSNAFQGKLDTNDSTEESSLKLLKEVLE
jgi:type I restriction enzyme S subunit